MHLSKKSFQKCRRFAILCGRVYKRQHDPVFLTDSIGVKMYSYNSHTKITASPKKVRSGGLSKMGHEALV